MNAADVLSVLRSRAISHLHHANSVTTSCTFLHQRGLASRGYVADRGLPQTPQYSDADDQRYGIWHDVFADTVDIHHRASRRNKYGPVLFIVDVNVMDALPAGSDVLVTRKNPTKWINGEPDSERFFSTKAELEGGLVRGTFDQMIAIRTPAGILPLPPGEIALLLDDPQRNLSSGRNAYEAACNRLAAAGRSSDTPVALSRRNCRVECRCAAEYAAFPHFDLMFQ